MTTGRDDVLPELMAGLFGRIRAELSDGTMGDLRMSHVRVLAAVPGDGVNVTELARSAGMTKQGCGQFVTHLAGTGHLRTSPDPADGRVRLVFRTPAGDRFMTRRLRRSRADRGRVRSRGRRAAVRHVQEGDGGAGGTLGLTSSVGVGKRTSPGVCSYRV